MQCFDCNREGQHETQWLQLGWKLLSRNGMLLFFFFFLGIACTGDMAHGRGLMLLQPVTRVSFADCSAQNPR